MVNGARALSPWHPTVDSKTLNSWRFWRQICEHNMAGYGPMCGRKWVGDNNSTPRIRIKRMLKNAGPHPPCGPTEPIIVIDPTAKGIPPPRHKQRFLKQIIYRLNQRSIIRSSDLNRTGIRRPVDNNSSRFGR